MKVSMLFGSFNNSWGWRVEWEEAGQLKNKDFIQKEDKANEAKEQADAFKHELLNREEAA